MYLTSQEWKDQGIPYVSFTSNPLDKEERESSMSFLESDSSAEITTALKSWQKRLENLGYRPVAITQYPQDISIRVYVVPKKDIGFPVKARKSKSGKNQKE